ncbi:MAG: hypothetical protein JXR72_04320 [Proteobacteria bacterium]|nr:hypothetical protein [Pseudomonadota bacterium]
MEKKKVVFLIGLCLVFAGCATQSAKMSEPATRAQKKSVAQTRSMHNHPFKIQADDFEGYGRVEPPTPASPDIVTVCFSFKEATAGSPDYPLYIIPPQMGGVHWVLRHLKSGKSFSPPCAIRAFKLNPADRKGREKGHLQEVHENEEFCTSINIAKALEGQNLPPGPYSFAATYSWNRKDPELVGKRCPGGDRPAKCFTIFQGEIRANPVFELPLLVQ